jgi:hypothetical protein
MNDLVVGTYGRGFWVLDDMTPLRELAAHHEAIESAPAYFFKPGDAIRSRINVNWDQPTSVEVPHAPNPPYGAILYYYLKQAPTSPITLQVFDSAGKLVRTMSSTPPPATVDAEYPDYWLATPESRALPTAVGTNRTHWDLHYDDPPAYETDLENQMNMVEHSATSGPHGPQALPGTYTLKLTVDGKVYTQQLVVNNDPREPVTPQLMAAMRAQQTITLDAYEGMKESYAANEEVGQVRAQLASLMARQLTPELETQAKALDTKLATFGGQPAARGGGGPFGGGRGGPRAPGSMLSFLAVNNSFNVTVSAAQVGLDMAPTQSQIDTWLADCKEFNNTIEGWKKMTSEDLANFNKALQQNQQQPLSVPATRIAGPACNAPKMK